MTLSVARDVLRQLSICTCAWFVLYSLPAAAGVIHPTPTATPLDSQQDCRAGGSQACCDGTPYNVFTQGCCAGEIYSFVNRLCVDGVVQKLATPTPRHLPHEPAAPDGPQLCTETATRGCCGGTPYSRTARGCCDQTTYSLTTQGCCAGVIYNSLVRNCNNGVIEKPPLSKQPHEPHVPQTQVCTETAAQGCCDGTSYSRAVRGCCDGTTYSLANQGCCAGLIYNSLTRTCDNGKVNKLPVDKPTPRPPHQTQQPHQPQLPVCTESATQGCCDGTTYSRAVRGCCDGTTYSLANQGCCAGVIYNSLTRTCNNGVIEKPAVEKPTPRMPHQPQPPDQPQVQECTETATQGCCDGTPYSRAVRGCCAGTTYTFSTQGCCAGVIYNNLTRTCNNGVIEKPAVEKPTPRMPHQPQPPDQPQVQECTETATQGCCDGTPYSRAVRGCCAGTTYTFSTQGCCRDIIYNSLVRQCVDGVVRNLDTPRAPHRVQ